MDKSRVRKMVAEVLPALKEKLGLSDWVIKIELGILESEGDPAYALCSPNPDYKDAIIEINYDIHKTKKELIHTIRHELLHIFLADFKPYNKAVKELTSEREYGALEVIFYHIEEKVVRRIEDVIDKKGK